MNKKILLVLSIMVVAAVVAGVLVGCGETKLANPRNMNITDGYFTWGAVNGADGYLVYFNDDLVNRYYVDHPYLSIDEQEIRSSLKSGQVNYMYIRAVNLKNGLPVNESDRSLIKFNYSRQLATPNKVQLKGEKFSWRAVSEAKDYKAYVRRDGQDEGNLYSMTWSTGTANVSGTINDLADGYMYYVSIVACAEGFDNSVPSVEVPFDRTVVNVDSLQFYAYVDGIATKLADAVEEACFEAELSLRADSEILVKDNLGNEYPLADQVTVSGDYKLVFNTDNRSATLAKVTNYYLYVGNSTEGVKLSAADGSFEAAVNLADGAVYSVKDDQGNSLTAFADDSVNMGTAFAGGTYTVSVDPESKLISVRSGGIVVIKGDEAVDGMWPVSFHYNYPNSPAASVVYVEDNRTMATPATPVRQGFIFEGWYEDSYCLIKAEFGSKKSLFKITAPTDFYAKWTVDTSADPEPQPVDPDPEDPNPVDPPQPLPDCDYHVDSDGDGKCDKCGRDMPSYEDTFGTIYLDTTKFDWWGSDGAVINMHVWYTDGTNNNWPGAKMTLNADGLYEAQYYTSRVVKGIIFTRNDPNPNPNEGIPTEWDRIEIGELDFNPLKPIYRLKTFSHQGDVTTFQGKWMAAGEEDVADVVGEDKVYLDFRDVEWFADAGAKLYAYIWYADGSQNAAYPGKEMTFTTDASAVHYSAYVDCSAARVISGIIFTRNNPALTPGSDEGVWNKLELSTELGNLGWTAATPALKLTVVNGNSFEGTWESEEAALSAQPVIVEPQPEDPQPSTPWDGTVTVDLSAVTWFADNDCVAYLYVWYADGDVNATYPGAKMSGGNNGLWTYRTDATKSISGMIVIRVSADETTMYNKSGDITAIPSNHLVRVEQSDVSEIPEDQRTISAEPIASDPDWDGTITFNITWEYFGTADAYLYVWYTDGTNNHDFPGVKMSQDGSGNFVGQIDTTKTVVGVIVARCNPETGEKWNQSGDITSIPTSHHITIEWMN